MSKFAKNKKDKGEPAISTASLPDIVFMLLFFFMVVTNMKEDDPKVRVSLPSANEVSKLEDKSAILYVYIGPPLQKKKYGSASRIQMNDDLIPVENVRENVEAKRTTMPEALVPKLMTSLKVDKETKMGIVTDVKQELRKSQALKINYATVN